MSTRSSIFYSEHQGASVHLYNELMDDIIYLEVRAFAGTLLIPVGITRRGVASRISGRWSCYIGWHLWFLDSMPKRTALNADGTYALTGTWSYRCTKCQRLNFPDQTSATNDDGANSSNYDVALHVASALGKIFVIGFLLRLAYRLIRKR